MSTLTRSLAALALVLATMFAFAHTASAQESPEYSGQIPATLVLDQGGVDQASAGIAAAQPAQAAQATGALPYTGSDSLPLAQIGVALLAVGTLTTVAVRRRSASNR